MSFTLKDVAAVIAHIERLAIPGVRAIQDPPMQFEMRDEVRLFLASSLVRVSWFGRVVCFLGLPKASS